MLRKVVVVEPLSRSNTCFYCQHGNDHTVVVCEACQKIQPFPAVSPNFFDIFELSPSLEIDDKSLRDRFYSLSQKTHPDTQAQKDDFTQMQAARWSTLINKAFQTLKITKTRLDYILELNPQINKLTSPPPRELAESYFELQEVLMEGDNQTALNSFFSLLELADLKNQKDWAELVSDWQRNPSQDGLLLRLKQFTDNQKYLDSLKADLIKKRGLL
ncbi:MAG: DnaJ family molecular chaperone [Pseudomonadota bacterium]